MLKARVFFFGDRFWLRFRCAKCVGCLVSPGIWGRCRYESILVVMAMRCLVSDEQRIYLIQRNALTNNSVSMPDSKRLELSAMVLTSTTFRSCLTGYDRRGHAMQDAHAALVTGSEASPENHVALEAPLSGPRTCFSSDSSAVQNLKCQIASCNFCEGQTPSELELASSVHPLQPCCYRLDYSQQCSVDFSGGFYWRLLHNVWLSGAAIFGQATTRQPRLKSCGCSRLSAVTIH